MSVNTEKCGMFETWIFKLKKLLKQNDFSQNLNWLAP